MCIICTPSPIQEKEKSGFYCSRIRTGFDEDSLEWLEQLFRQTVGNEKEIRRDDFKKILITKNVSLLVQPIAKLSLSHLHGPAILYEIEIFRVAAIFHGESIPDLRQRQFGLDLVARISGRYASIRCTATGR